MAGRYNSGNMKEHIKTQNTIDGNINGRRSRTVIFSVNVANEKMIEHTANHFLKTP